MVVALPRRDFQSSKEAAQAVWDALENAGLEGFAITAEEKETDL